MDIEDRILLVGGTALVVGAGFYFGGFVGAFVSPFLALLFMLVTS